MKSSAELEQQAALQVLNLMAAAARTAPKTRGIDNLRTLALVDALDKDRLMAKMRELAVAEKRPGLERDANCIANSPAILLLGVESNSSGLNCDQCGYATCESLEKAGGVCAFNSIDLGIAVGSAVGVAADCRVDTRVMFSIGRAAVALGLFAPKVKQVLGLPLSITGKSPFFDRKA